VGVDDVVTSVNRLLCPEETTRC